MGGEEKRKKRREGEKKGEGREIRTPLQIGMVTGLHPQLQKPGKVREFGKVGGK